MHGWISSGILDLFEDFCLLVCCLLAAARVVIQEQGNTTEITASLSFLFLEP